MTFPRRCTAGVFAAVTALGVASAVPAAADSSPKSSPSAGAQAAAPKAISSTIKGVWKNKKTGEKGKVTGSFVPRKFVVRNDTLYAIGMLTMNLRNSAGKTEKTVERVVRIKVQKPAGTDSTTSDVSAAAQCDVLNLLLGPLNLNLLGLLVTLNQVDLDIIAVPGAGNLLGNLLCSVAGLLDGAGALTQIADLLNQILGIINGGITSTSATSSEADPAAIPTLV